MAEKTFAPSTSYNLANGYSAIAGLRMRADPEFALFSDTELVNAKVLYLCALKLPPNNGRPEVLVNLGNCYDHLGRTLDALEYYDKALRIDSNHAMATGNKGTDGRTSGVKSLETGQAR